MSSPTYSNSHGTEPGYSSDPNAPSGYPPHPGPPSGYPPGPGYPSGYPGGPPPASSKTPMVVAGAVVLLALIGAAVFLASGSDDGPADYAASTPAAVTPAVPGPGTDADAQGATIVATPTPPSPAPTSAAPAAPAAPSRAASSGGAYTVGVAPGNYSGSVDATGLRQLCETYERTSVARFRGLEVCYNIRVDQHRDGSLSGTGYKSFEALAGTSGRDLPPAEQSPVEVSGYIDNNDTIHLEYAVQGARRKTKGVAIIDATRAAFTDSGGNPNWAGSFRTDASNASGSASYTGYALRD